MLKVRLMGERNELENMLLWLRQTQHVLSVSDFYPCRNSEYVRVYVEVAMVK